MPHHEFTGKLAFLYSLKKNDQIVTLPADSILSRGTSSIIGRRIIEVSRFGYLEGMGRPGFLGFLLEEEPPLEYLLVTVWGAARFCLFDGEVGGFLGQIINRMPRRFSDKVADERWKYDAPMVTGSIIRDAELGDDFFRLYLQKDDKKHVLEILDQDERLPKVPRHPQEKVASTMSILKENEKLGEYIIFVPSNAVVHL